jgi:hypothetical protein
MKHFYQLLSLVTACLCLLSCSEPNNTATGAENNTNDLLEKQTGWLLGTWQNNSGNAVATETWQKLNDSVYAGKSYVVVDKDTVSSESISLRQTGNTILYIPTVKDQNEGLPVTFTMSSASEKLLVFENPGHDFPQKITYTRTSKDALVAEISGILNGEKNAQQFPLTRVP